MATLKGWCVCVCVCWGGGAAAAAGTPTRTGVPLSRCRVRSDRRVAEGYCFRPTELRHRTDYGAGSVHTHAAPAQAAVSERPPPARVGWPRLLLAAAHLLLGTKIIPMKSAPACAATTADSGSCVPQILASGAVGADAAICGADGAGFFCAANF